MSNDEVAKNTELEPEVSKKLKWNEFVESVVVDFFQGYELEKMTMEDGNGNKAKLSRTRDNELKIEQSSTTII